MARPNVYEDHWFGTVLHTIRERGERMANEHFMGGTIWEQNKILLLYRNWRRMQSWDAPREAGARGCRRFLAPVGEIMFFHQMHMEVGKGLFALARALFEAPPSILWWNLNTWLRFCRREFKTDRKGGE
jgi:hypothetical protein